MERVEGAVSTGIDANGFGEVRGAIHRPGAWNGTGRISYTGGTGGISHTCRCSVSNTTSSLILPEVLSLFVTMDPPAGPKGFDSRGGGCHTLELCASQPPVMATSPQIR